jgi:ABC transporter substrate binding protein
MEEATGAPSSFAVSDPKRLRASGRDGETVMTEPPSLLRMLLSRHTKRREFITLFGGAAAAWPLGARAQQPERMRRIGVVVALVEDDPESVARRAAFEQALQASGWTVGRNIRIDYRWGAFEAARTQKLAAEIAALAPGVILVSSNVVLAPMMQAAPTTPIVFTQVIDPLGSGFVESMARPGGNVTGFTQFEYSLAGKHRLQASNDREIDDAFASLLRLRASALVIAPDVHCHLDSRKQHLMERPYQRQRENRNRPPRGGGDHFLDFLRGALLPRSSATPPLCLALVRRSLRHGRGTQG